jgi:hypothetical protein
MIGSTLDARHAGAALNFPVGRRRAVKIAWSTRVSVRTGTDFNFEP